MTYRTIPDTVFDPERVYRYVLTREWLLGNGTMMVIGLNPSTADEVQDDATIRRLRSFAADSGYARIIMTNLFAFRATDPKVMRAATSPVGPDNDLWLLAVAAVSDLILCAWGAGGTHMRRGPHIESLLRSQGHDLHVLRLTKDKHPEHPLRLPKALRPTLWRKGEK